MKRRRLAFVLTQDRGGPVDMTVALARWIADQGGTDVRLFAPPPARGADLIGDLLHPIDVPRKTALAAMRRVRRAILEFNPDVVHAQDRRSGLLCVGLRRGRRHRRLTLVHTYHGVPVDVTQSWLVDPANAARPSRNSLVTLRADALVARAFDATVVPSPFTYGILVERLRVPRQLVHHIDNGLPLPHASPPSSVLRLIYVGMLIELKGVADLVSAVDFVHSELPRLHLDIVGDGPLRDALTAQVIRAGLEQTVTFHGFRQDVPQLLATADVFVLPSTMEQQPLVLIEAMASGKLIVATDVGGVPDMLRDAGDAAVIVAPRSPRSIAEGLVRLSKVDDPTALGESIAKIARERFSIDASGRRHLALYDRLQSSAHAGPKC